MLASVASVIGAYLIGCISFAILASRLFRLPDPRTYGSGNPGATNVLRSGRKSAALVTLLGDTAKGWVAVMLASYLAPNLGFAAATIAACGLAVFLGHLYPLFFGFKGGKGVATALGVLFGFSTWLAFAALTVFAVVLLLWRFVSLASIAAAIGAALGATAIFGASPYTLAVVGLAVMIIWRHRANLQRLLTGTESKIAAARSVVPPSEPG
jgi:glycerol-3-phosphate acyltransferase PlsY